MTNTSNWSFEDHQEEVEMWLSNDEGLYEYTQRVVRNQDWRNPLACAALFTVLSYAVGPDHTAWASFKVLFDNITEVNFESIWELFDE